MVASNPYFAQVRQIFSGRTGRPYSMTSAREYLTRWRVIAKIPEIGPESICVAPGLPRPWTFYDNGFEYDPWALLIDLDAKQEHNDDWQSWIVEARYSTQMPRGGPHPEVTGSGERPSKPKSRMNNPEDDPPDIKWSFDSMQRALPKDLNGMPFVNSALQPFTPAPTFDVAYAVLTLTRNELDFDRTTATRYAYAVNSDKFMGCKPGTVQCLPPEASMEFRGPLSFWTVTYKFRFGPPKPFQKVRMEFPRINFATGKVEFVKAENVLEEPDIVVTGGDEEKRRRHDELEEWQPRILDCGTMERLGDVGDPNRNGKLRHIKRDGVNVSNPVLLDGAGKELLPDEDGVLHPKYMRFRVYQSRPFKRLFRRGFVRERLRL